MKAIARIEAARAEMQGWRHALHAQPETAFEETRTAELVAQALNAAGIEVHRGLAGTGVVGTLRSGTGSHAVGLRADMDALPIQEANTFAHRSRVAGKMHACGHDGHVAMLLGAAKHLAATREFDGTVHFIFQPAEENEGGGRAMVQEGLFERFPVDAVFGMHNWPGLPVGEFAVMPGPMMASSDVFEITLTGRGGHAAMPHHAVDPIVAGSHLVQALQTIVSRNALPADAAVVTVTQFHGGDAWNVIPGEVVLRGTARAFRPEVQDLIESGIARICNGVATAFGAEAAIRYERRYPPTVNTPREAAFAAEVMRSLAGDERVHTNLAPTMGAEDFAFMLQVKPGAYAWIGNGPGESGCVLHNPRYDFNDEILALGASYWVRLAERFLARAASHT
ncbi:MAG: amidohydrolase [Burkholderiales bacterium]|nr:amidohydrolase [Burkholderiales bacterium]